MSRLLHIACSLPIDKGPEQVAASLIERVSAFLPTSAIGVSLGERATHEGPGHAPGAAPHGGSRFVGASRGGVKVAVGVKNGRLFPEFAHERVVPIDHEQALVHLHVAVADAALLAASAPLGSFVARVAEVLGSALRAAVLVNANWRESLELKEQVIQSAKLASLGQMTAGVVHELTNPLTAIVGYADYLQTKAVRQNADPGDVERLRRIGESAGRILRFSRDLMAYARPSTEPPSPVPIHAVIDQAIVFCEHALGRTRIHVERRFARDIPAVVGMRDQLTQVFVNLITNACHAMEAEGGTLTLETSFHEASRTVRSAVRDTGRGIDKENLGRIFEPFFTTKTDGRGTGLGLSIVQNIVLSHGGAVAVDSQVGHGATFSVEFPAEPT
jgi:signal transduction histidine kinase